MQDDNQDEEVLLYDDVGDGGAAEMGEVASVGMQVGMQGSVGIQCESALLLGVPCRIRT